MAAHDPVIRRLAATKAAQARWKRPASETTAQLAEAQLADHIKRVVDQAPQLSAEQRDRLALLLQRPSAGQRPDDGLTPGQPSRTDPRRGRVAEQTPEGQL